MKSKYFLTLLLIGVLPVAGMLGTYAWLSLTEAPAPAAQATVSSAPALQATLSALYTQDQTLASSLKADIEGTYRDMPKLAANHTPKDLSDFVGSHTGLAGIVVFSSNGTVLSTVPATAQLTNPAADSRDEFNGMMARLDKNGGNTDLFFTRRLSYPAFVFAIPLEKNKIAQAVFNLSAFFGPGNPKNGEVLFIDGNSGEVFYDSIPANTQTSFNPTGQDALRAKIQSGLANKMSGIEPTPPTAAVYTTAGLNQFGIVRLMPISSLQPSAPKAEARSKDPIEALQDIFMAPTGMTLLIAAAASFGWIFLVGAMAFGMILGPLRKASAVILNASKGGAPLTPQSAKAFGGDEVGQIVSASALLQQKLEDDKQKAAQEQEEAMRRGRAEVDAKNREAANQVANAQQQAQAAKNELTGVNQQLSDKLKELEAMKGMSEGLRNQTEQAKAEIGKLKSQVTTAEDGKAAAQKQVAQVQDQVKEMEGKLLNAVAASSAIQVSTVRAAAIRTMSEELKTTLGIIKGYVSSALGTPQGGINEKQQEFLGMVINRSARLEKFINDLVDIYQVEIEQEKAVHEEINLASEIEGLAFNFQAQAEVKNIKMKVEAKGTVPKVPVVRRRFNQLWNILYLQIIKDAPRGSSIPISVEPIGDTVKVTVQDPGMTVTPEALPRLFDEFYDPKHTASPQLAGTGLKFALIKTILAANGGGAVAEKAEPGTRLILTFPTKVKKAGEAPAAGPKISIAPPPPTAPGLKPAAPALGAPKPPAPPGAPSLTPPGLPKPGIAPPSIGLPKPAAPVAPAAAAAPAPGVPGIPAAPAGPKPAGGGLLDSLISKVPPVSAPGLKPPAPAPGAPGIPSAPPTGVPGLPKPLAPAAPAAPGMPPAAPGLPPPIPGGGLKPPTPPSSTSGLLDSLMKGPSAAPPPVPGAAPAPPAGLAPKPPVPPVTPVPGIGAPKPAAPAVPGIPSAPPVGAAPKPPVPGPPASMAPKPMAPPVPGAPPSMAPKPAAPPMPGMPAPGVPAAPKVVPTNLKPTTPPPGILDLDNADGMKLDAGAPKPPAAAPRPPMPGMPPMGMPGAPKPPGVPPGGLDASKAQKAKDGEGELIE